VVYVFGLLAACLLGLGFVLQQHAAARAPASDVLSFRILWYVVRVPLWVGGIGCMVAGQILGGVALFNGDLSRVEPLLATNLLFALLVARRFSEEQLGWSGWVGAVLLSGGVAVFVLAGRPVGSRAAVSALRHWAVFGTVVAVAAVLVLIARHLRLFEEAPLLAAAGGALFGLQDALTRSSGRIVHTHGVAGLATSWQPYALVAVAATGLMLVQSAFDAGPLQTSLPPLTAAEPLVGIACGIGYLGDTVRLTPFALTGEAVGLVAAVVGVFLVGRHPALPTGEPQQVTADMNPRRTGDDEGDTHRG
jgi:drug/metabolite transporter (DMT)-like permease